MWTVIVRDPSGKLHSKTQLKVGVVTIGRGNTCDIVLQSPAVSRLHGRLLIAEGDLPVYSDEKSANGSMLDGQPILAAVDLDEHSVLMLGGFRINLEREGATTGADKTTQFSAADMHRLTQSATPPSRSPPQAPVPTTPSAPPAPVAASAPPTAAAPSIAAPPAPPKPATVFKSPLAGMEFKIPEIPDASARIEQVQHDKLSDSMAHLLEQQIRGIQSRRTEQEQTVRSAKEQFELAWREAIIAARELQGRIRSNPKILYYVITRDEQEVSVKIADGSRRGYANLILSRRHPESGKTQDGLVWYGVFGEDSYSFREPKDALEEFVRRIAGKLA